MCETTCKRFYEVSRNSVIEIGAAFEMNLVNKQALTVVGTLILKVFKMLSGMISEGTKP